jgi:signal transduction histidine kinase
VVKNGGVYRYNAWHNHRGGGEHPVEVHMRPHRLSSETVVLTTAHDDARRLMHLQALTQAKAEAESANRAKSAFLAITSHELRTPLTGIIGFCELLQLEKTDANPQTQKYLKLIAESSHSLLAIINDILDFSKIESRTLDIRPVNVDPDQVLDLIARAWRERAGVRGLKFVRQASTGVQVSCTSDPLRMRQMLDNLIGNAVKFTERGRIEIGLEYLADSHRVHHRRHRHRHPRVGARQPLPGLLAGGRCHHPRRWRCRPRTLHLPQPRRDARRQGVAACQRADGQHLQAAPAPSSARAQGRASTPASGPRACG